MGGWVYAWPWLWLDGDKHPGWQHAYWEDHLQARLPVPSDLAIDLQGHYDPATRDGSVTIRIDNHAAQPLQGTVQCVLTESGLQYQAPNGQELHNHVMRDMIPTETGVEVSIAPGEPTFVTHPFQLEPDWDPAQCKLVCFVQDLAMQPDSTIEIWQGAKIAIGELSLPSDVAEDPADGSRQAGICDLLPPAPNPAPGETSIRFELAGEASVRLGVFDVRGRRVASLVDERRAAGVHTVEWNGRSGSGERLPAGVYYCALSVRSADGRENRIRSLMLLR
ncbi:MAG: Omp28-related outer membrane protein [Candidatus Eisenbacteria bacterium]|nr:Omp28-related outer membrane protein [Candidatus Latescibacterota bacterium]MBD3302537.1 Omp28-related outer membrane protein [Candidatus Eisenbacteria bacterium]